MLERINNVEGTEKERRRTQYETLWKWRK